jgi:hypothetical protein
MKRITLLKTLIVALFLMIGVGNAWGQTEIFNHSGGGSAPTGWTFTNNVSTNAIDRDTYWLVDAGDPSDIIITASYDLSSYTSAVFNIRVATFGNGTAHPAKIEISYDGGNTFTQTETTSTPSSSTYIDGGSINLNSVSAMVVLRISNNGTSGRGVRLQNLDLTASGTSGPANPASFTATASSSTQIDLAATANVDTDDILVAYNSSNTFGTPSGAYSVGNLITGGGTVHYVGAATSLTNHTGLDVNTTYYYKAWSYDEADYSIGIEANATTLELESPTATAATNLNTTSFTANWNAATAATSYRLDVSEYETFEEAGGNATDLFISQVVENGVQTYVEIANFTGASVSLGDYDLVAYFNGNTSVGTTIDLTDAGVINNQDVWVVANSSATAWTGTPDQTSGSLDQNGNDVYALRKNSANIDVFGTIGNGDYFYENKNVIRNSDIDEPTTTYNSNDWSFTDYTGNSPSGLGSHTFSGGSTPSFVTGYNNLTVDETSQSVTGLAANTDYFYRVRAYTSNGDETSSNSGIIEVTTNKATETVSGTVSFSTLTNVGDGTAVSVTSGALTFDEAATIESLSVEHGVEITVNNGIGLQIDGDLHLKSPSSNGAAASFKDEGTTLIGGNYILERHIDAYTSAEDGWHLLASPFNENFAINGSDFDPVENDDDLYGWDEPTYTWLNHQAGNPSNFEKGKGYLVAYKTATAMRDFTASSDSYSHVTSDVELIDNASRTNNGGWHLVGNSFLSAVTWDTDNVDWLADNIEASAQVLDVNQSGNYLSVDKGETIQALQGFFVRVTAHGNNSLMLPASARTHSSGNFVKSSIQNALELKVTNDKNGYFDKTKVKILDGATQAYDADFDGSKLKGFTSAPQLYTVSSDQKELSINVISNNDNEVQMPLHFEARFDATYTIKLEDNTLPDGVTIFMTDLVLNQEINLNTTPTYSFSASEGDSPNRFLLHFGLVGLDENDSQGSLRAYTYNNTLYIQNSLEAANLRILDLQGRLLIEKQLNGQGLQSLPLDFPAGVYVVQLVNSKAQKSVKVIVE